MESTWLVVSVWLAGLGPQLDFQAFPDRQSCTRASQAAVSILKQQALSNMTGTHAAVQVDEREDLEEIALRSAAGREVARLRCVSARPR